MRSVRSRPARYRLTAQSRERPDCLAQHDKWRESYEEDLDFPGSAFSAPEAISNSRETRPSSNG